MAFLKKLLHDKIKAYNDAKRPLMVFSEISMYRNHRGMLVKKVYG